MAPYSLLVKPAGADCNLACRYCFYRKNSSLYPRAPHPRMTEATLAELLRQYPEGAIAFQGGEPTLMGEDFFRKADELGGGRIAFSLQTNGTLVTPSFARFLAERDWLVGVSVDGPEALHNPNRGGFDAVRRGYDALVSTGAKVNTLTLVNKDNVHSAAAIYRFLRDEWGSLNHQYIECVAPASHAISGDEWGGFLMELFDAWFFDGDARRVSVRLFDSIVARLAFGRPDVCQFAADCRNYLVVEWNGDVYPCDFHVGEEYRLGNIREQRLDDMFRSEKFAAFGRRKREWAAKCNMCEFLPFCMGDCPKNRDPGTRESAMCPGYRRFFAHALPRLRQLLAETRF